MSTIEESEDLPAGVTRHSYPASAMLGDYLRAAAGLVPTGVLFATVPVGTVAAAILGSFGAIFAIFGLRTVMRHHTRVEMSDRELRTQGLLSRRIAWDDLERMKLAYYSTRRDRKSGWLQLELRGGGARVDLDSRIAGFDRVVRQAAEVAAARGLVLSDSTLANLEALGIEPPGHRTGW